MSESRVLQQIEDANMALNRAHAQLRTDSLGIRHELETIAIPLLAWVYDAHQWIGQWTAKHPEARELYGRLREIEGLVVERRDVQIAYNVETAMDKRVTTALEPVRDALYTLLQTAQSDPLVVADEGSSTAPMVDLLRQMAEGLGAR